MPAFPNRQPRFIAAVMFDCEKSFAEGNGNGTAALAFSTVNHFNRCSGFHATNFTAKGMHFSNRKTAELLGISQAERPAAVQLFGDDPAIMAEAARRAMEFAPDVVVGLGGYASAPTLYSAQKLHIPTLLQEQNSLPGITNRMLAKKADRICVDYDEMDRFFPKEKIVWTGNPIRQDISDINSKRDEAFSFYKLDPSMPVVLIMGGSLGALSINVGVQNSLDYLLENGFQVIWQTGKYYYQRMLPSADGKEHLVMLDFVRRVDLAYAAADIIVSRAGAITISELCVVGKPVILVPSPNVAEDHQTKNAQALSAKNAAILLSDDRCPQELGKTVMSLYQDTRRRELLSQNIARMGTTTASRDIVDEVLKLAKVGRWQKENRKENKAKGK